jgi:hypothetical protein
MSWTYWSSAGRFQRRRGDRTILASGKATCPQTASAWGRTQRPASVGRPDVKALVLNALGGGFDFEDVDIAASIGQEVLVDMRFSKLGPSSKSEEIS